MNFWKTLGIKKTTEKSEIKKAYRAKLKKNRPDEDEAGFIKLREAYEYALEYAENNYEEVYEDAFEEDYFDNYEDYEESEVFEPEIDEYTEWNIKLVELWGDLEKKYNPECWRELLYEGAPYKLKYYEIAREKIKNLVYKNTRDLAFLPVSVHKVIDGFFHFSDVDEVCIHLEKPKQQKWINEITRISASIILSKLHKDVNPETVDDLLSKYYLDIYEVICERKVNFLDDIELKYLPLETIKISRAFDKYSEDEFRMAIDNLKAEYGEDIEIDLMMAERMIFNGENPKMLVEGLYEKLPEADLAFTYRLMNCCIAVGMYYESYMLVKHIHWMFECRGMNLKAEEISNIIESGYKGISDTEHIQMCRMYLRSDRKKEAVEILEKVKETDSWEYHMARTLAYFNENDITPGIESYEILANYPKEDLHFLQKLEWEELQGRYYFENKEYEKCLDKCRDLLKRYPESYPIMILRAYADKALNHAYGNYEIMCDLWRVYGERSEVSFHVAQVFADDYCIKDARNVIEDIADKYEIQFRYLELRLFNGTTAELKKEWMDFLNYIASKKFKIDVKSKYGLLDLETILRQSTRGVHWENQERGKYKEAITKIYKLYNFDTFLYYYLLLDDKKMLIEAQKYISDVTDIEKNKDILSELVGTYAMNGMFDEVDNIINKIDNREVLLSLYSRVVTYCRYTENYEKGVYYALEFGDDMVSMYSADILIEMSTCYHFMGKKDPIYYEKSIDAANKLFSIWGKHYTDGANQSPYVYLAYSYAELGQVDKAMESLDFLYKYAENNYYRYDYNTFAFVMYLKARMPEKAFEYVIKAENGEYLQIYKKELGYMMMGYYEEAYNNLLIKIEDEGDDEDCGDLHTCAMHSKYFMDGYIDKEFVLDIKAKIEKMLTMPTGANGANYFHLAHVNNILGNEEEANKYEELAYSYDKWDGIYDKIMYIQLYTLWTYWYNKEYEKAYEYCKSNIIYENYFEVVYLEYFLKKMFDERYKKG